MGGYRSATLQKVTVPPVGPRVQIEAVPAQTKPISQEKVDDWFKGKAAHVRPDQLEFLKGRGVLQRNVIRAYQELKPSTEEIKNAIRTGQRWPDCSL
jgi:hypothetical protein